MWDGIGVSRDLSEVCRPREDALAIAPCGGRAGAIWCGIGPVQIGGTVGRVESSFAVRAKLLNDAWIDGKLVAVGRTREG